MLQSAWNKASRIGDIGICPCTDGDCERQCGCPATNLYIISSLNWIRPLVSCWRRRKTHGLPATVATIDNCILEFTGGSILTINIVSDRILHHQNIWLVCIWKTVALYCWLIYEPSIRPNCAIRRLAVCLCLSVCVQVKSCLPKQKGKKIDCWRSQWSS